MLIAIANPAETSPSAPALPVAPVSPRGIPSVKTPVLVLKDDVAEAPGDNVLTVTELTDNADTVGLPFVSKLNALDARSALAGNVILIDVGSNTGALIERSVSSDTC